MKRSWLEKREIAAGDIAECFAGKSSITVDDFREIFLRRTGPPPIMDFNTQYLGDRSVLEQIFDALSKRTGLDGSIIERHYDRDETFAQFAEHLLRAGAYRQEGGE